MKKSDSLSDIINNILLLGCLVFLWSQFAPAKYGGPAEYIIVNGISMQPTYHSGDLVISHVSASYQVGEVVAYWDKQTNRFVIHRIVGLENGQYTLKGDNNPENDIAHPTQSEIVGKQWLHLPGAGSWLGALGASKGTALALTVLGGVVVSGLLLQPGAPAGKTRKNKPLLPASLASVLPQGGNWAQSVVEAGLYVSAFLALLALITVVMAFSRPIATQTSTNLTYQQSGNFFYSASGTSGVYDTDTVRSGEPIFPKLTCNMSVGFTYSLTGDQLQNVTGTHQLSAVVMDAQSGWQRTIPLVAQTAFNGNSYSDASSLNLCQILDLVAAVETQTEFSPSTYTLLILPRAAVSAQVGGQSISDTFEPVLKFAFDKVHFYYVKESSDPETKDPLNPVKSGKLSNPLQQTNSISLLGFETDVASARRWSVVGLVLALCGLGLSGLYIYDTAQQSQDGLMHIKLGNLVMNVYDRGFDNQANFIEVADIDDLARLAERQNTSILHFTRGILHYYLVQANGTTYRYVVSDKKRPASLMKMDKTSHAAEEEV